ncbi:MAG: hypothetical protein V4474_04440 [Patescibacteria group bacterium]
MCKYLAVGSTGNTAYSGPDASLQRVLTFVSLPFEAANNDAAFVEARKVALKSHATYRQTSQLTVYPLAGEGISVPLDNE